MTTSHHSVRARRRVGARPDRASRVARPFVARLVASVTVALGALLLALLALLLVALSVSTAAAQGHERRRGNGRLAVVDTEVLLDSAPARADADRRHREQATRAERMLQGVADSLRLAVDELMRVQDRLTAPEREAALHLVRAREIQFEDMVRQLELAVAREREALMAPVLQAVRDAVRHVRQRDGWGAIVDRRSLGAIADVDEAIDVTRVVLAELRGRTQAGEGGDGRGGAQVTSSRGAP